MIGTQNPYHIHWAQQSAIHGKMVIFQTDIDAHFSTRKRSVWLDGNDET
jgi:hypothetical protein